MSGASRADISTDGACASRRFCWAVYSEDTGRHFGMHDATSEIHGRDEAKAHTRLLQLGIVGGGDKAAALIKGLEGFVGVHVAGVLTEQSDGPAREAADEAGVFATTDSAVFKRRSRLDLVIDARDESAKDARSSERSPVEAVGPRCGELLLALLSAAEQNQQRAELLDALQRASERYQSQERRLTASKDAIEASHAELQAELSELYFMHEFFKLLTRYTSVDDICSLVADGVAGVLGFEISAVYLANYLDWTLELKATQGCSASLFAEVVSVDSTILGRAFADGSWQEADVAAATPSSAWIDSSVAVRSQAAVALSAGDRVVGVLLGASRSRRELSADEMDRFSALADHASLSLHNALLLAELERLSVTDRLTQLYNHGHFHVRLEEEFNRSDRFSHQLSLMMLDIDDFKAFNDRWGHPRGDDALRVVSAAIQANLREMDVAARYGGEEFVVLLPETDHEGARLVAERIRSALATEPVIRLEDGAGVWCSVSAGIATFPENASNAARLVETADLALYSAKRGGKNRVESADSGDKRSE